MAKKDQGKLHRLRAGTADWFTTAYLDDLDDAIRFAAIVAMAPNVSRAEVLGPPSSGGLCLWSYTSGGKVHPAWEGWPKQCDPAEVMAIPAEIWDEVFATQRLLTPGAILLLQALARLGIAGRKRLYMETAHSRASLRTAIWYLEPLEKELIVGHAPPVGERGEETFTIHPKLLEQAKRLMLKVRSA